LLFFDVILFYLQHKFLGLEFFISVEVLMTLIVYKSDVRAV